MRYLFRYDFEKLKKITYNRRHKELNFLTPWKFTEETTQIDHNFNNDILWYSFARQALRPTAIG